MGTYIIRYRFDNGVWILNRMCILKAKEEAHASMLFYQNIVSKLRSDETIKIDSIVELEDDTIIDTPYAPYCR